MLCFFFLPLEIFDISTFKSLRFQKKKRSLNPKNPKQEQKKVVSPPPRKKFFFFSSLQRKREREREDGLEREAGSLVLLGRPRPSHHRLMGGGDGGGGGWNTTKAKKKKKKKTVLRRCLGGSVLVLVACLVIMIVEDVMSSSFFSSTRKSSSSSSSSSGVFGGRAEKAAARGVEYGRSSNRGARVASSSPHSSVRGDGDEEDEPDPSSSSSSLGYVRGMVHDMDQYVYKHLFHSKYSETHGIEEEDDDNEEFTATNKEKTLDETTDEVHQEVKLLKEKIGPSMTSVKKPNVKPTGSLGRRERSSSSGGGGSSKDLACRLRECDTINAPFELGKAYTQNFIMSKQSTKTGNNVKVPKFLGIEGQKSRMARGKSDASIMHKQVKWSHLGGFPSNAAKCLPERDIVRQNFGKIKSCAVVGNGGGLLLKEYGEEIDAHDAVIRFNGGITKGFEKYVGKRTTYRLANFDHFAFHEENVGGNMKSSSDSNSNDDDDEGEESEDNNNINNKNDNNNNIEIAVLQHVTRPDALTKYGQLCEKGYYSKHGVPTVALHPEFHYFVLNTVARGGPSNGFYGTIFANEICQHITLYGFQKNWKGTKVKYHYYDEIEPTDTQGARDSSEKSRFEQYVKEVNAYSRKCSKSETCIDRRVDKENSERDKIVYG